MQGKKKIAAAGHICLDITPVFPANTAGTVAGIPTTQIGNFPILDVLASGRTLAIHMYALLNEGLYMEQAYATAVVLLVMVLLINGLSSLIAKKFTRS